MKVDPFATLGLPRSYDVDLPAVEKTHRELSRALHPDRFVNAGASERREALSRAVEVNEAWRVVRDPIRRAEALLQLAGAAVGEEKQPPTDPEFLMEMLEQREALSEAKQAKDLARVHEMAQAIEGRSRAVESQTISTMSSALTRAARRRPWWASWASSGSTGASSTR